MSKNKLLVRGITFAVIVLFIAMSISPLVGSLSIEKHASTGYLSLDSISVLNDDPCYPVFNGTMGNGCYISPVNVSFVYDPEVVAKIYYSYSSGRLWTQYTEPFVIYEQGDILFMWYWVDHEGEESSISTVSFFIDYTPPDTEDVDWEAYKESGTWYVKFTCDAVDENGMDRAEMFIDDMLHETITGPGPIYEFVIEWSSAFQTCTFKFVFYDMPGNSANESVNGSDIKSFPYSQSSGTHQSNHVWSPWWLDRFPLLQWLLGWFAW